MPQSPWFGTLGIGALAFFLILGYGFWILLGFRVQGFELYLFITLLVTVSFPAWI